MPNVDEFELVILVSHFPFTHIFDVMTDLLAAFAWIKYIADVSKIPATANTKQIKGNFRFMIHFQIKVKIYLDYYRVNSKIL